MKKTKASIYFTSVRPLLQLEFLDTDVVLIDLPTQRPESYAFSVPLTSIYSLIVHPPTLSSWCKFSSSPYLMNVGVYLTEYLE